MSVLLQDQVICLIGASSGIGAAIAHALYRHGGKVAIGARRLNKLTELVQECTQKYPDSNGSLFPLECDVTSRESVQNFCEQTCKHFDVCSIDTVINCAGVMYFTKMKNAVMDQWDQTIDVNCRGATNCMGAVLPQMVQAKKGKVISITSDAGVRDFPNLAVYCASKRFVETLTEITRRELVGTGVTLHTIQPGDVKGTELIMKNTDMEAAETMGVSIGKPVGEGFTREQLLDPSDVADAVLTILKAPPHVAINSILIEPRDQE
ncbi:short-chain dehydrogenase/reductase Sdr [Nitzschia inconspicua]|uniref:NADP-dependent 3-hydroxy acid dehydrogenase YdfG n=1 Tax=Nitzschia inconspicua TaxID=303405 RepID=A0A9K3LXQ3_9STRA|nr:short-chain dehydrogenase/reductase Sdr [Nitzschia inconspicua]KAG7368506.1 short-chain dehydrogenase/reductase Sdr [Nitzschia inconspicua]